jgi:hypothetical protein
MIIRLLKKIFDTSERPKPGTWEHSMEQRRLKANSLPPEPYVAPCGGTNPNWDKGPPEIFKIEYEDDDESFPAQASRLDKWIRLKREGNEDEPEAIHLRELLDRSRPVSIED